MSLFIKCRVKMFNRSAGTKHRLDTNVFILLKKKKREGTFIFSETNRIIFMTCSFQGGFFSNASGKLFYLDLLSEQRTELCNNICIRDWLHLDSWDGLCSFTEVPRLNHWKRTEKPVSLTAAHTGDVFSWYNNLIVYSPFNFRATQRSLEEFAVCDQETCMLTVHRGQS